MSDFISLICPSCGGNVEIREYNQKYLCSYCGNEVVIKAGSELEKSVNQVAISDLTSSIKDLNEKKQDLYKNILRIDKDISRINNGEVYKIISLFSFFVFLIFIGLATISNIIHMNNILILILGELFGSKFILLLILLIAIYFFVFGLIQYTELSRMDLSELKLKKNEMHTKISELNKDISSKQDQLIIIRELFRK